MNQFWKKASVGISAIILATVTACGGGAGNATQGAAPGNAETPAVSESQPLSGQIRIDGSSTVFPISQAVAEEFMYEHEKVDVTVGLSGSSNGIKSIINGEAEIANASRHIKDTELEQIRAKGDDAYEMPVAYDGITVVINSANDWATEMTVEELKKIWEKGSTVTKWSEVREGWPDQPITLFAPGAASGTFEYFTEAINGKAKEGREEGVTASEDDNVLVQGVAGDINGMGYFGYSYYEENKDKLKAVAIKETADSPAVLPTLESIGDSSYKPLSREIFIYPLKSAMERKEVQEFLKFYMSDVGQALAEEVGYVRLPQAKYDENLSLLPQ